MSQTIPSIYLYNTQTRQKQKLTPLQAGRISLYTCGPTVYDYAHIGNFRTYVFEDVLKRALQFFGLHVTHVMNLTDVDDKTIRGALQHKISLEAYTQKYKTAFFEDIKQLILSPADHYPAATEYIDDMIVFIQSLLEKKYAYVGSDNSIYYALRCCPSYGKLSHLKLEELKTGASNRIASDEYDKEHASDFVLWKIHDPQRDGDIFWKSPFGDGRPGWHLECSAMAIALLGETIDIHVGGIDNMFPHHENEIAQSEAHTGHTFVNLWMHSEHLLVDGKKMSKSLGNFYTLRDLLAKGYTGVQVRYFLLQAHYKTQLNFTLEGLESAKHSLQRLHDFIWRLQQIEKESQDASYAKTTESLCSQMHQEFSDALADDLNISDALATLFNFVRDVNRMLDAEQIAHAEAKKILQLLEKIDTVLAVLFATENKEIPQEILDAAQKRQQARQEKNWALADEMRVYITEQGYSVEDTPSGPRLRNIRN